MNEDAEQAALFTGGNLNPDGRTSPIRPGDGNEGTPSHTFDVPAAEAARELGMAVAEAAAPLAWLAAAEVAVVSAARLHPDGFTADDVVALIPAGTPAPPEPRAMGPVLKNAQRAGIIRPTEEFRNSRRVSTHRSPRRVWVAA